MLQKGNKKGATWYFSHDFGGTVHSAALKNAKNKYRYLLCQSMQLVICTISCLFVCFFYLLDEHFIRLTLLLSLKKCRSVNLGFQNSRLLSFSFIYSIDDDLCFNLAHSRPSKGPCRSVEFQFSVEQKKTKKECERFQNIQHCTFFQIPFLSLETLTSERGV